MENLMYLGIGLLLLSILFFIIFFKRSKGKYEVVTGTVVDRTLVYYPKYLAYEPVFSFTYAGKEYRYPDTLLPTSNPLQQKESRRVVDCQYCIGDTVALRVYKNNPKQVVPDKKGAVSAYLVVGILFLAAGAGLIVLFVLG